MDKQNTWSTSDVLSNRNNWSLAADAELLKHLQALSEKIFSKAASTLQSLNSFENDINQTCISIANTSNKFKALSDTQFIESKVQEESSDINEPSSSQVEAPADQGNENITVKLKEALENGFQVLDTQYDIIPVTGSDSEDDEPQEILLRARNPYLSRRLPHIIGSEEFTRNDNLGLIDSSSSEEEEEDDEETDNTEDDEEERKEVHIDSDEERITIRKPPSPKSEIIRPQTQIIRISSSDSEDSEISNSYEEGNEQGRVISENKNMPAKKFKDNEPVQNSYTFAEHLSATLKNNPRNIYNIVPPDFGDTPPPFPGEDNSISSDKDSEDSDDFFTTKKSSKHSTSNTNYNNYENDYEKDEDDNRRTEETAVISQKSDGPGKPLEFRKSSIASKTSQHSDSANSSSATDEAPAKDMIVTSRSKPKLADSNVNSINKRIASAINAELSAKLNLKSPLIKSTENLSSETSTTKSSEIRTSVESTVEPLENHTPPKTGKPKATSEQISSTGAKKDSKKPVLFDKLKDEIDDENNDEDDLFSGTSATKKATSKSKKSVGLFDDDEDNIDNLFSPVKSAQNSSKKSTDLFSSKSTEPAKPEKPANDAVQPPVVDLFKNSNLFASDSDSEDDIFSIIKGQKKPDIDIFKTKTDSLFEKNPSESEQTPISSNDTRSTKPLSFDPVIKSAPTENKPPSFLAEKKQASSNSKTSPKTADSAKPSIDERNTPVDVLSTSKNNIFEDKSTKKTSGDLFDSDDDDDDDDLFSKSKSAEERKSTNENTNVSKTQVHLSPTIGENTVKRNRAFEIPKNIHSSLSTESTNEEKKSSQTEENIAQRNKTINAFAKRQPPRLSLSSSEDEDVKPENISVSISGTSGNVKNDKTDTTSSPKKDELFNKSSTQGTEDVSNISPQIGDIFGEYGENIKNSKDENMFDDSYGSRSAMYLPPKDDSSDDFFEDEDIKDSNYLSQEDEDMFDEKLGSPPFQGGNYDDDIFGERGSAGISQEFLKTSVITDATPVEGLFAKSTSSSPPIDLFTSNNLFGEQKDDLKKDEKCLEKNTKEKLNLNPDHENQLKENDGEVLKNSDRWKIDPVVHTSSSSESKDGLFDEPKESELFNFTETSLRDNESDIFGVVSIKNENSLVAASIAESKETEQIKPSEKISSSNDSLDQINKSDENPQDESVNKNPPSNSKIGKISTSIFEETNFENRPGEDVHDGNLFTKSASPPSSESASSTRNVPGKLAIGRGLNINVNALLPGSKSSKIKSKQSSEQVTPDEKQIVDAAIDEESQNVNDQSTGLLNNIAKERPKLSSKRRPPSRKARKSRIINDDLFDSVFVTESLQEEEKSSVINNSPKIQEKTEIKKSEALKKTVDDLFADSDDKIDDFFASSKSKPKPKSNIKLSGTVSSSEVSNATSSREGNDSDLDLEIGPSLNPLPSLKKSCPKPQKRSSALKKTSEIPSVISDEKITPPEPELKSATKTSETLVDTISTSGNPSKTIVSSTPGVAKNIFDSLEDDDDNLFEIVKSKKNIAEKPVEKVIEEKSPAKAEVNVKMKPESKPIQQQPTAKSTTVKNTKINIFNDDDDDELFTSAKTKLPSNSLSKKSSLFEDNDDDDLFGNKTSMPKRKTSDPVASSAKTKVLNEKPRIVKLRSEIVQKDPLTGKDVTGPL